MLPPLHSLSYAASVKRDGGNSLQQGVVFLNPQKPYNVTMFLRKHGGCTKVKRFGVLLALSIDLETMNQAVDSQWLAFDKYFCT